jgi:hypothetical protein
MKYCDINVFILMKSSFLERFFLGGRLSRLYPRNRDTHFAAAPQPKTNRIGRSVYAGNRMTSRQPLLNSIFKTSKNKGVTPMHRFLIVVEKVRKNYFCLFSGSPVMHSTRKNTQKKLKELMHEAIQNAYPWPRKKT